MFSSTIFQEPKQFDEQYIITIAFINANDQVNEHSGKNKARALLCK